MKPGDFGPVQRRLIDRAEGSTLSMVYVADYREMRAARYLVRREIFVYLGAPHVSTSRVFILRTAVEEVDRNA